MTSVGAAYRVARNSRSLNTGNLMLRVAAAGQKPLRILLFAGRNFLRAKSGFADDCGEFVPPSSIDRRPPPTAISQDFADRQHCRADFVIAVVEVRRDADAGLGAEINLDIARQQLV